MLDWLGQNAPLPVAEQEVQRVRLPDVVDQRERG